MSSEDPGCSIPHCSPAVPPGSGVLDGHEPLGLATACNTRVISNTIHVFSTFSSSKSLIVLCSVLDLCEKETFTRVKEFVNS